MELLIRFRKRPPRPPSRGEGRGKPLTAGSSAPRSWGVRRSSRRASAAPPARTAPLRSTTVARPRSPPPGQQAAQLGDLAFLAGRRVRALRTVRLLLALQGVPRPAAGLALPVDADLPHLGLAEGDLLVELLNHLKFSNRGAQYLFTLPPSNLVNAFIDPPIQNSTIK